MIFSQFKITNRAFAARPTGLARAGDAGVRASRGDAVDTVGIR